MVLQEVCTHASSMPIIYREEGALRPLGWIFFLWPGHVQDDGDSVFVIVSLNTLMSISRITCYQPMCFRRKLGFLKVFERVFSNCMIRWISIAKEGRCVQKAHCLCFKDAADDALRLVLELTLNFLNDWVVFTEFVFQTSLLLYFWAHLRFHLFFLLTTFLLILLWHSWLSSTWKDLRLLLVFAINTVCVLGSICEYDWILVVLLVWSRTFLSVRVEEHHIVLRIVGSNSLFFVSWLHLWLAELVILKLRWQTGLVAFRLVFFCIGFVPSHLLLSCISEGVVIPGWKSLIALVLNIFRVLPLFLRTCWIEVLSSAQAWFLFDLHVLLIGLLRSIALTHRSLSHIIIYNGLLHLWRVLVSVT